MHLARRLQPALLAEHKIGRNFETEEEGQRVILFRIQAHLFVRHERYWASPFIETNCS